MRGRRAYEIVGFVDEETFARVKATARALEMSASSLVASLVIVGLGGAEDPNAGAVVTRTKVKEIAKGFRRPGQRENR